MKQILRPGHPVDFLTPAEFKAMAYKPRQVTRVRAPATINLDGSGNGKGTVFEVEAGREFEVRRIVLVLTGNVPSDPNTGNVLLNAAGKFVAYMRSDSLIEYGQPMYGGAIQVPGVQTWSREQGPYLRNQEAFGIVAGGLTANGTLNVYLEGILTRPGQMEDE